MDYFRLVVGPDEGANTPQLCARAVLILFFGVLCVRIAGRRTFAQYSPLDIVVALIVGSNLSRVMTGKADMVPACSATLVLVCLHRLLAIASMRWSMLPWLLKSRPIEVIRDGEVDQAALRRANLSRADLDEAVRSEQAASVSDVRRAMVEGSGKVSVVHRDKSI